MDYKYYLIWFIYLFSSFEGFGLREDSWGGLGKIGLGWFGLLQLLTIIMTIIFAFKFRKNFYFNKYNKVGVAYSLVLMLMIIILIQSLVMVITSETFTLQMLFSNLIKMKYIFFYFPFVYLLSVPNGIRIAINSLTFGAVVSTIIVFIFLATGYSGSAVSVLTTTDVGREFRVILPTSMLISFGFFYYLTKIKFDFKKIYILGLIVCFMGTLIQMHRNIIISIAAVTLFAVIKLFTINAKSKVLIPFIVIILFFGINTVFNEIGYSYDNLIDNYELTVNEITSREGNFGIRYNLPILSFKHVVENYFLLGVGLQWEEITDIDSYLSLQYFATPNYDSSYNNIIVVFGVLGILVYINLFITLFRTINVNIKYTFNNYYVLISYSSLFLLIYLMMTGIATDNFILMNSTFMFTFIIALTYTTYNQNILTIDENNCSKV